MEEEFPPIARRIREARERAGLTQEALADALDLTPMSVYDLETYDEDAFLCVSIAQFLSLAKLLGLSAREIVAGDVAPTAGSEVSIHELVRLMLEFISKERMTVDAFGEHVGWDVERVLAEPQCAWDEWCLDTLRDVCAAIGVPWNSVLPE